MSNAVSLTNTQLTQWRRDAVALRERLGAENVNDFTCDECGVKNLCSYVYAPANTGGECAAQVIQKAPREVAADFDLQPTIKY